jgi:hypothetical protein
MSVKPIPPKTVRLGAMSQTLTTEVTAEAGGEELKLKVGIG